MSRIRSVSEPSLQVLSGNYTRERARKTDLDYERGKDKLAHWIGAWSYEEVSCAKFKLRRTMSVFLVLPGVYSAPESRLQMSHQPDGVSMDRMLMH